MSTDRNTTRIVRSWLAEGVTALPDRVLDAVLDQVPATPQRRSLWPARRITPLNTYAKAAIAAAAVLAVAIVGYNLLPRSGGVGASPTPTLQETPSASPAPLAVGSFQSHGANIELLAWGEGSNVTGTLIATDVAGETVGKFTLVLGCARTSPGGLVEIGGVVTEAVKYEDFAPKGARIAIVLQPGTPVRAFIHAEYPDPPKATCQAFLESILPDLGDPGFDSSILEPIVGTIELRP